MRHKQSKKEQRKNANECVIQGKLNWTMNRRHIHRPYRVGNTGLNVQNLSCKSFFQFRHNFYANTLNLDPKFNC